jgi:hypothetical protein
MNQIWTECKYNMHTSYAYKVQEKLRMMNDLNHVAYARCIER